MCFANYFLQSHIFDNLTILVEMPFYQILIKSIALVQFYGKDQTNFIEFYCQKEIFFLLSF